MIFSQRLRRNRLLLLLIGALLVGALPVHQADARTEQKQLDNTVPEFVSGRFQRASASDYKSPADGSDSAGAVQLSTIGLLKFDTNSSSSTLPVRLQQMGAVVVNDNSGTPHIYVVGGLALGARVSSVYSVRVDTVNGSLPDGWVEEASLNAQQGSNRVTLPVAPISSPGVATAKVGGTNYIYVIGGSAAVGTNAFSSYAVRYASVGADGRITDDSSNPNDGWRPVPGGNIPQTDPEDAGSQLGLIAPAVTTFTVPETGITYIYILGGLQQGSVGSGGTGSTVSTGSRAIFAARVGANGLLYKANTSGDTDANRGWQLFDRTKGEPEIPVQESDIPDPAAREYRGLWDAVAVADRYPASTIPGQTDSIYVMGGQLAPSISGGPATYNNKVYQFLIKQNGQLELSTNAAIMPTTRYGHSGFGLGGNLYLTGGIPGNTGQADKAVLTSKVLDSLQLEQYGGPTGANFLQSDEEPFGLPAPRAFHATVIVPSTAKGGGFVYVIGGRGSNSPPETDDNGSDTVFYSEINDKSVVNTSGYASDGWYYSRPFALNTNVVDVREISWATFLAQPGKMDVAVAFRVSADVECKTLESSTTVQWQELDGDAGDARSVDGSNTVSREDVTGRCFQYRARLTTSPTANPNFPTETPLLLRFSVKIVLPGSPDLKINNIAERKQGENTVGLSVGILNRNDTQPTNNNPTLPADVDGGGSFFVELFVFTGTTVLTPAVPLDMNDSQFDAYHRACAQVPSSAMGATTVYTITQWYRITDPGCNDPAQLITDAKVFFPQDNQVYSVLAAVDTACYDRIIGETRVGCINELDADNGENNNVKSVQITVTKATEPTPSIALPLISRTP